MGIVQRSNKDIKAVHINLSSSSISSLKCRTEKLRVNMPSSSNQTLTTQNGLHDINTCLTFWMSTKMEKLVLTSWSSRQTQKYARQLKLHRNKRKNNKKKKK